MDLGSLINSKSNSFRIKKIIRNGGKDSLFLAESLSNSSQSNSLNVIKKINFIGASDVARFKIESKILAQLKSSPYIVTLLDVAETPQYGLLIFEHCPGGTLADLLHEQELGRRTLDEAEIWNLFEPIVLGVAALHLLKSGPVLHRDLSVENIAIDSRRQLRLCNFGSATDQLVPYGTRLDANAARRVEADMLQITSPLYRAPELYDVHLCQGMTEKVDIWALGVVLYKICYKSFPFGASAMSILNSSIEWPHSGFSSNVTQFIGSLLQKDALKRPNIYALAAKLAQLKGTVCKISLNPYANNFDTPSCSLGKKFMSNNPNGAVDSCFSTGKDFRSNTKYVTTDDLQSKTLNDASSLVFSAPVKDASTGNEALTKLSPQPYSFMSISPISRDKALENSNSQNPVLYNIPLNTPSNIPSNIPSNNYAIQNHANQSAGPTSLVKRVEFSSNAEGSFPFNLPNHKVAGIETKTVTTSTVLSSKTITLTKIHPEKDGTKTVSVISQQGPVSTCTKTQVVYLSTLPQNSLALTAQHSSYMWSNSVTPMQSFNAPMKPLIPVPTPGSHAFATPVPVSSANPALPITSCLLDSTGDNLSSSQPQSKTLTTELASNHTLTQIKAKNATFPAESQSSAKADCLAALDPLRSNQVAREMLKNKQASKPLNSYFN